MLSVCDKNPFADDYPALAVGKDWSTRLTGEWEQINMHML